MTTLSERSRLLVDDLRMTYFGFAGLSNGNKKLVSSSWSDSRRQSRAPTILKSSGGNASTLSKPKSIPERRVPWQTSGRKACPTDAPSRSPSLQICRHRSLSFERPTRTIQPLRQRFRRCRRERLRPSESCLLPKPSWRMQRQSSAKPERKSVSRKANGRPGCKSCRRGCERRRRRSNANDKAPKSAWQSSSSRTGQCPLKACERSSVSDV